MTVILKSNHKVAGSIPALGDRPSGAMEARQTSIKKKISEGCGFDPRLGCYKARLAQSVEHETLKNPIRF